MRALLAQLASSAVLLPPLAVPVPARAQVKVIVQGGAYLPDVGPVRQAQQQASAGRSIAGRGSAGEATTAGARIGVALSDRWTLDGGVAWSRSTSRWASVGQPDDSYTPHLGTTPVHSPGARLQHDFVLLAGLSWRAH